ncbi:MAG: hypothetical protein CMJ01_01355 [Pelagibacteraceae bacterium]|nr:hypothetical protein [Pelagibacteraceae bacterium]
MPETKELNRHFYGLDLLRGISGYGVAVCHFFAFIYQNELLEYLSFIFVEFFFVLSGFVLVPQLLKVLDNKKNLIIFYQRRWLRTLPLFFICLIIISLMFDKFLTLDFFKYFFFLQDFLPNFLDVSYYPVVWSLSIEEFFYLIFPIFLFITNKNDFLKKCLYLFLFLIFIKLFIIEYLDPYFIRTGTLLRFDAILLGFLIRFFYSNLNLKQSVIFSIITVYSYILLQDFVLLNKDMFVIKFFFIIFLQLLSVSILILFLNLDFLFKNNFLKKISVIVSKQTYSVYLTHMIFIYALIDLNLDLFNKFTIYMFLLIAISTISYYFIEKPILKTRPNYL